MTFFGQFLIAGCSEVEPSTHGLVNACAAFPSETHAAHRYAWVNNSATCCYSLAYCARWCPPSSCISLLRGISHIYMGMGQSHCNPLSDDETPVVTPRKDKNSHPFAGGLGVRSAGLEPTTF